MTIPQETPEEENSKDSRFKDHDLNILIGNILRYGVISSMIIVVIGFVLYLKQPAHHPADFNSFITHFDKVGFNFSDFLYGMLHGDGLSIMALGILLLILTPVFRVIFAILGFHKEGDKFYTIVSLIVLIIIIFSTFLGRTGA